MLGLVQDLLRNKFKYEILDSYLCVVINVLKSVKSDGAAFLME